MPLELSPSLEREALANASGPRVELRNWLDGRGLPETAATQVEIE